MYMKGRVLEFTSIRKIVGFVSFFELSIILFGLRQSLSKIKTSCMGIHSCLELSLYFLRLGVSLLSTVQLM